MMKYIKEYGQVLSESTKSKRPDQQPNPDGWLPITAENIKKLKPGFRVRFHDGYAWKTRPLDKFWISRGYIGTGLQGETANFLRPMFGKVVYCDFGDSASPSVVSEGKKAFAPNSPYLNVKELLMRLGYEQLSNEDQRATLRTWFSPQPVNGKASYTIRQLYGEIEKAKIQLGNSVEVERNDEGEIVVTKFKAGGLRELERAGIDTADMNESTSANAGLPPNVRKEIETSASLIADDVAYKISKMAIKRLRYMDKFAAASVEDIEESDEYLEMTSDVQYYYVESLLRSLSDNLQHPMDVDSIKEAIS